MGAAGLCSLLLLLLLGVPGHPEGPPPLCDPRVLEWFILEARDAERALAAARAQDVRGGVATLEAAVQRARELLPDPRLRPLLERANSAARSLARLLREMTAQVAPSSAPPRQWQVRSLGRLLAVHSSFLHGKVRLFLMDACRQ
ncbi:erythropoietin isoform X2 [Pezoporus occidentalis]|uniref:erythropoietin isoform X2 n=1 Tax=Pezoporus occidentalis TaxID=407982 RepID=UPI002F90B785